MTDAPLVQTLPAPVYHARPEWGSSALKAMRKGPPARVLWERNARASSDAMRFGTAVHAAFLEPLAFRDAYACKPDGMSFATKEGKAWRAEQDGKEIVSFDDYFRVQAICDALGSKLGVARALSAATHMEGSIFWTEPLTGEACKGRIDLLTPTHLYDLKVSRHAGPGLAYRAFYEGWMHQLAFYRDGLQTVLQERIARDARLIVVSPVAPHFVWTLEVKRDALDLLSIENQQTLHAMGICRRANVWPGTPDEWTLIEPPATALIAADVLEHLPEESD
jgi:hypothetical protein